MDGQQGTGLPWHFAANLVSHLRRDLGERDEAWFDRRVVAELSANLARIAAGERGEDSEAVLAAEKAAPKGSRDRSAVTVRRRVRYWTDGVVIGSETFVREVATSRSDAERTMAKRLAGEDSSGSSPFSAYRRLDPGL